MFKPVVILLAGFMVFSVSEYASAESGLAVNAASCSFSEWVNTQSSSKKIDENSENMLIREQWERGLGIDIFYPYFKARELESKVSKKTSVRVLKIRGKPQFKSNEAKYIFNIKF